ncbi:conserved hypothetical protein [Enterobacterales bacterium 8AC]|nr:conserved hypothetical protein [Enterobacterales bacterium 8AC]
MTTPEKSDIEIEIVNEIKLRLSKQRRNKKWLAYMLGIDYGKVKRILSNSSSQQLSLSIADQMLVLLGSNLREVVSVPVIRTLRKEIEESLSKYDFSRY